MILEIMGKLCNPKIWLRFPGWCDIRYFRTNYFDFSTTPFNHLQHLQYRSKSYLRSETHIAYKFYTMYPKMGFFRWEFLFVRRKRHVRFKSVFSSYQVVVQEDSSHTRFRWSYLAKHVLHLKSHWNFIVKILKVHKFCYISGNPG